MQPLTDMKVFSKGFIFHNKTYFTIYVMQMLLHKNNKWQSDYINVSILY